MLRFLKYVLFFQAAVLSFLLLKLFFWDVPLLARVNPGKTAFMTLYDGPADVRYVPLSRISPHLARAVVAAEDSLFYGHGGVDWDALRESWEKNSAEKEYVRGGSTITMQLAKNLYLTPAKNVARKALEILIALKMNADLPKERILEIYLNVIEWGDGVYGAEAAARRYFRKSAESLSPYEAAYLTAIIPNPVKWGKMPPGAYVRRRIGMILARMNSAPGPDLKKLASVRLVPQETSSGASSAQKPAAAPPKAKKQAPPVSVSAAPRVPASPAVMEAVSESADPQEASSSPPDPKEFFLDDH